MSAKQWLLRLLLGLTGLLLLLQLMQLCRALWLVCTDAFLVSGFVWGALVFKAVLLLCNAALVVWLWRLSGFGAPRRSC